MNFTPPTGKEIASMLAVIPPRPNYADWLKICSAVWSALPFEEGAKLLNAWSPEEKAGEYAMKHKARCKKIGIGSLIKLAKEHGWKGEARRKERLGRIRFAPVSSSRCRSLFESRGQIAPHPQMLADTRPAKTENDPLQDAEAHRIAGELMKAYEQGIIAGRHDPRAQALAAAINIFDARIL